jgi:hypothetical protein
MIGGGPFEVAVPYDIMPEYSQVKFFISDGNHLKAARLFSKTTRYVIGHTCLNDANT